QRLAPLRASGGEGLWLMLDPDASVHRNALLLRVLERFPNARIVWAPLACPTRDAGWLYDFDPAAPATGVGADFLTEHPMSPAYARAFMRRRSGWDAGTAMNRFLQVETVPTLTGAQADERLPVTASRRDALLRDIVRAAIGAPPSAVEGFM